MTSKDPDWLDFHPSPNRPSFVLPPGAVDAHCHVFGPAHLFPYAPGRRYTPCDASAAQLLSLRDHLGFSRNVVVQATCHGTNNAALVDALRRAGGAARGVASVGRDVSEEALDGLHEAGVRAVRFNFVRRLAGGGGGDGLGSRIDEVREVAGRIGRLGWHVVVYFEAADLAALEGLLRSLPTPVVVDHMGTPDVSRPAGGPDFARFRQLVRDVPDMYVKVTCPERLSRSGPPALDGERAAYRDVVPFARALVDEFPDRVLWGTDWPHPNLKGHMPDDGLLVDFIPSIAPGEEAQRKLLVDNPVRLYWPEEGVGCARGHAA